MQNLRGLAKMEPCSPNPVRLLAEPAGEGMLRELVAAAAKAGLDVVHVLTDNDACHALKAVNGLIVTGPTGTNVNDVAAALLRTK